MSLASRCEQDELNIAELFHVSVSVGLSTMLASTTHSPAS
jgi:hypothetical protein